MFGGVEQLFLQFFSGAQPGVDNLDVFPRNLARQPNHLLSKIGDTHRLAHIEHEYLPSATNYTCLEDQLTRLRNGHEITCDIRMRNRHGTTVGNLILKQRDDAAGRPHYVPKTHRDEFGA